MSSAFGGFFIKTRVIGAPLICHQIQICQPFPRATSEHLLTIINGITRHQIQTDRFVQASHLRAVRYR